MKITTFAAMMTLRIIVLAACTVLSASAFAQEVNAEDSVRQLQEQTLDDVVVTTRKSGTKRMRGAINGLEIGRDELFKAACCNLGESFVTNASVDVNYSDAATGARQIKLLGLSGTYVQLLTENIPNFRGAAIPYALGYVPGPWMKSIQVSKGAASVKNGYESLTGQINIEYLKPEDDEGVSVNVYGSTMGRFEANADANVHLSEQLFTNILAHFENNWSNHDGNGDGFIDDPRIRQYNLQNRWLWKQGAYMFHGGLSLLKENREGGQSPHLLYDGYDHDHGYPVGRYRISMGTNRYEAYMKHAVVLNAERGSNIALMTTASMHEEDARYGYEVYAANEKNVYGQLMYETNITPLHHLSTGVSVNYDYLGQHILQGYQQQVDDLQVVRFNERETTPGAYAQYTFNYHDQLTVMAGLRLDHSSVYGTFVTPRVHIKYMPADVVTFRLSAGKGYRTPHAWAENHYLLSSGRTLVVGDLEQEEAWNYGASMAFNIPMARKTLKLNAEYYYTHFLHQAVVDYDSDFQVISIDNLRGRSYSHTLQIDATYPFFKGFELTAAWRLNDVKTTFGQELKRKPLTSRYKGLLTASYKTPLGIWQFDATLQLNGGGRMPTPYTLADGTMSWESSYPAYAQLSAQVTRWFRHFSLYIGGENLTNYRQKHPIIDAGNPWGGTFEPTVVWGPVTGAMAYIGLRLNFGKHL